MGILDYINPFESKVFAGALNKPSNIQAEQPETQVVVPTSNISIVPGKRIIPTDTLGIAQQQAQQSYMLEPEITKKEKTPGIGNFGSRKTNSHHSNKQGKRNGAWNTGFGQIYDRINERKSNRVFTSMDNMLKRR
jgi:hypothetical protein